jgi:putative CocE/NonD family hydrolase
VPSFDDILLHPDRNDDFWNTRAGGNDSRGALTNANIPILIYTGFYDIYTGGMFDLWNAIAPETKAKCAMLVHPYDHGCNKKNDQPIVFDDAPTGDVIGRYALDWIESIRKNTTPPIERGKITYYKLFGNEWLTDDFAVPEKSLTFALGEGEKTYTYNPYAPAKFKGGLSANFGGNAWQYKPGIQHDVLTFYTPEFEEDTFIKGKMTAKLRVRSDCEDTCFYIRLSLVKTEGHYGLRDDINQISNFAQGYVPGEEIEMSFTFDEHAFVIKKGEKLRIDVSSSAFPLYVRHTNNRGHYALQTTAKIAHNTVVCDKSSITLLLGE